MENTVKSLRHLEHRERCHVYTCNVIPSKKIEWGRNNIWREKSWDFSNTEGISQATYLRNTMNPKNKKYNKNNTYSYYKRIIEGKVQSGKCLKIAKEKYILL